MADILSEVQPGDLITADLLNAIIRRLQGDVTVTGTIDVPSLFGQTLAGAVALLQTPGSRLQVGVVLDSTGSLIAASDPGSQGCRVLNQSPVAGLKVPPATLVNLVIAPASASTVIKPTISSFDKSTVEVGDQLHVFGTNFDQVPANNKVKFGTIDATVSPASSSHDLLVTVPVGADTVTQPVAVNVTVGSQQATKTVNVIAASGPAPSTITAINGSSTNPAVATGQVITITGTNFGTAPGAVIVFFGANETSPSSVPTAATGTTLTVAVPTAFPADLPRVDSPSISVRPFLKVAGKTGNVSPVPLQISRLV